MPCWSYCVAGGAVVEAGGSKQRRCCFKRRRERVFFFPFPLVFFSFSVSFTSSPPCLLGFVLFLFLNFPPSFKPFLPSLYFGSSPFRFVLSSLWFVRFSPVFFPFSSTFFLFSPPSSCVLALRGYL